MKTEIIPGLVSGDLVGAWALTEPHCGTDAAAMTTSARKTESGYVLNGSKMFITNGGDADWVMVAARTDTDSGHKGISNFLVKNSQCLSIDNCFTGFVYAASKSGNHF